jgi:hypothetical protein
MATLNIFYNSDKDIAWTSFAACPAELIAEQKSSNNLDHLSYETDQLLDIDKYYINNDGDDIVAYSTFSPTYSATSVDLDTVINITGLSSGTEVFLDSVSAGTMSDSTLTLTAVQSGQFLIELKKAHFVTHGTTITVKRRGE